MKKIILILIIIFATIFANESKSQETKLYLNFQELMKNEKTYKIYIVVDLFEESRVYRYRINGNSINDIFYESKKDWEKVPIELEFNYDSNPHVSEIEIWYTIKTKNNCVDGEKKMKIKRCKNNFLKFEEGFFGIKVKKSTNPFE